MVSLTLVFVIVTRNQNRNIMMFYSYKGQLYYKCNKSLPVSVSTPFSKSFSPGGQATSHSDASRLPELQKTISSLQEAVDQREKQLAELSAKLEEAQRIQASLQLEKDDAQEENAGLLQNYTRLQASVTELQTRVQEQEGKALQKAQLDHEIQMLRQNLEGILPLCWFMFNIATEYCCFSSA